MAEGKVCVCPQCGKKFKLKPEFSAASFACTGCGATVWVEGKPAPATPSGKRRGSGGGGRRAGRSGGRSASAQGGRGRRGAAAPAPARGRRGHAREDLPDDEEGHGRGRYQKPKNNSMNLVFAGIGLVLLIVIPVLLFTSQKSPPEGDGASGNPTQQAQQPMVPDPDSAPATTSQPGAGPATNLPAQPTPGAGPTPPGATDPGAATGPGTGTDAGTRPPADEEAKPTRQLGGSTGSGGGIRKSRYDPEPDLGHASDTDVALRGKIDQLVDTMFDPFSGIDGQYAKKDLIAIGKPAFLPVLARMAKIRDQLPDEVDPGNIEMNQLGASLKLGDELLRELDGYLTANEKDVIRPGHSRKYVAYILRLHYKRWLTVLKDLPEMPGPFDPSQAYDKEEEQFDGG